MQVIPPSTSQHNCLLLPFTKHSLNFWMFLSNSAPHPSPRLATWVHFYIIKDKKKNLKFKRFLKSIYPVLLYRCGKQGWRYLEVIYTWLHVFHSLQILLTSTKMTLSNLIARIKNLNSWTPYDVAQWKSSGFFPPDWTTKLCHIIKLSSPDYSVDSHLFRVRSKNISHSLHAFIFVCTYLHQVCEKQRRCLWAQCQNVGLSGNAQNPLQSIICIKHHVSITLFI